MLSLINFDLYALYFRQLFINNNKKQWRSVQSARKKPTSAAVYAVVYSIAHHSIRKCTGTWSINLTVRGKLIQTMSSKNNSKFTINQW